MEPKIFYPDRLSKLEDKLSKINSSELRNSMMRLIVFFLLIGMAIYTFQVSIWLFFITLVILMVVFLYLVKRQLWLKSKRIKVETQIAFYQNELKILDGHRNICYNGNGLANEKHDYALDLDIIGSASLYEKINRSKTYNGTKLLGEYLLSFPSVESIKKRQEAVAEICAIPKWREDFHGSIFGLEDQHEKNQALVLEQYLNFDSDFVHQKTIKILMTLTPYIWGVLFFLYFYLGENYRPLLYAFGIIIFVTYFKYARKVGQIQLALSESLENFHFYTDSLHCIFDSNWKSDLLKSAIVPFTSTENKYAVRELAELKKLVDLLDYRLNMIAGIALNLFLLWDLRMIRKISIWQSKNNHKIQELFAILGLFETISSLAIYKFNHPEYSFPLVSEGEFIFKAKDLKHPLIKKESSIGNDFNINSSDYVSIITGSNMSGKSTFLRAVGINLILGNAGSVCPVKSLQYSVTRVMTYMRIKDSLEENASTFKAELNRIKQMLELLNSTENTLLLIDEMLRGTNSKDKLKGSIAITKKILQSKSHCIIATHDLELTSVEKEAPEGVHNYYFDIDYDNGDLRFDYKIKPGICQNFNASYLLEKIGIQTNPAI